MKKFNGKLKMIILSFMWFILSVGIILLISIARDNSKDKKYKLSYEKLKNGSEIRNESYFIFEDAVAEINTEDMRGNKKTSYGKIGGFIDYSTEIEYIEDNTVRFKSNKDIDQVESIIYGKKNKTKSKANIEGKEVILEKESYSVYKVKSNRVELSEEEINRIEKIVNRDVNFFREEKETYNKRKKLKLGEKWRNSYDFNYLGSISDDVNGDVEYEVIDYEERDDDKIFLINYSGFFKGSHYSYIGGNVEIKFDLSGFIYYSTKYKTDIKVTGSGKYRLKWEINDFSKMVDITADGNCNLNYINDVFLVDEDLDEKRDVRVNRILIGFILLEMVMGILLLLVKRIED